VTRIPTLSLGNELSLLQRLHPSDAQGLVCVSVAVDSLERIRIYLLRWFLINDVIANKMMDVVPRIRPMIVDASEIMAKLVTSRWYAT
jgi:hypothetical protein